MLQLVGGSLRLDPGAFQAAFDSWPQGTGLLIWIVLIGGVSLMLGQSVVLFANRVSPARFFISLMLGALKFSLDVLVIVLVVWGMANILSENDWLLGQIGRAIALASAPYWFSLFFLIPYLGLIIERVLKFYVILALIVAVQSIFGIPFLDAILASVVALLLAQVASGVLGKFLDPLADRITDALVGDARLENAREIYKLFASRNQISLGEE
jgi:hypothetical protein